MPPQICHNFIEVVKLGDFERFMDECKKYQIELRNVKSDPSNFSQNLIFTVVNLNDEEVALKIIIELIESGVDLFEKDTLKQTPLFYAARDGKCKLVKFFCDQGIQVNDLDGHSQSAIFYAASSGQLEACKVLFKYGADHD